MNAWKFIKQHRNNIVCYGSLTLVFVLFAILTKGQDLFRLQPEEPGRTDGSAYDHFYRHDLHVRSRNRGYCFRSGGRSVYHGNYSGIECHRQRTGGGASFHSHGGGAVSVHVVRHSLPGTDEYYCFLAVMFIARGMLFPILSLHDGRMNITRYDLIQPLKAMWHMPWRQ